VQIIKFYFSRKQNGQIFFSYMINVKNHIIIPQKKKFKTISKGVFWAAGRVLTTRSFFAA
jgi:hypothetical protein